MSITPPIISVAPMLDYTDRHARYFLRLIAKDVRLYTEMITTNALLHGDAKYLLKSHPAEKYLALQLGGSDPKDLATCAKMGEDALYNEINLNVGCPSERVKSGRFGACLMQEPELVADCIATMRAHVYIPVTVKCRIGVDDADSYAQLSRFISLISQAGCPHVIIHARKAWLSGLSPKQNRTVPPLRYDVVYQIKKDFPSLTISINGGIKTLTEVEEHLQYVDGVMIGRAAYANPYLLADLQKKFFKENSVLSRHQVIEKFLPYVDRELQSGIKLNAMTRHMLGLFQQQRGAASWRRYLSEYAHRANAGTEVIEHALKEVS